jgi:hypothetical protein
LHESKEMPVIPVNRVADNKKNNQKKMEGQGEGEAQGVAAPPPKKIPWHGSSVFRTENADSKLQVADDEPKRLLLGSI